VDSGLQIFNNSEFGKLGVLTIEGKSYFPATECARILGYAKPHNAIDRHCRGVAKRGGVSYTTNQYGVTTEQAVEKNYIPEGDLYRLIIRSKLPAAERFESWIFDEVLPSIREHGMYVTAPTLDQILNDPDKLTALIAALKTERDKGERLKSRAEANRVKRGD